MVGLPGGILDGGENVLPLKEGIIGENFFVGSSRGKQIEDVRDAHAKAADTRASAALAFLDGDPLQASDIH